MARRCAARLSRSFAAERSGGGLVPWAEPSTCGARLSTAWDRAGGAAVEADSRSVPRPPFDHCPAALQRVEGRPGSRLAEAWGEVVWLAGSCRRRGPRCCGGYPPNVPSAAAVSRSSRSGGVRARRCGGSWRRGAPTPRPSAIDGGKPGRPLAELSLEASLRMSSLETATGNGWRSRRNQGRASRCGDGAVAGAAAVLAPTATDRRS